MEGETQPAFVIPRSKLKELTEFSNGGFFLFIVNELGDIEFYRHAENQVCELALEKYIERYIENEESERFVDVIEQENNEDDL